MIVLVGFMGAGKTTVGRLLATELGLPFADSDALIEERAGSTIADIVETEGESEFRALEREVVAKLLDGPEAVVALGGGALGDRATCTDLEWANVVHLDVTLAEAMRRMGDGSARPMLVRHDPQALFNERAGAYERAAKWRVSTDALTPEQVAREVAALVTRSGASPDAVRRIVVDAPSRSYEVAVGSGIAERVHELIPKLPEAEKAMIVGHPGLAAHAELVAASLRATGLQVTVVTVPEGERSKSLEQAANLYAELVRANVHRDDLIVAVGGGVVGDLAGFAASTFNRGMALVQVPTTLLAQVDAAIGGKTAVNLPAGKNLVGTFHQPCAVVCDVALLDTLPEPEFVGGLAEVVKYGFIRDPALLALVTENIERLLKRDHDLLIEVVARCVAIKAAIVESDERDEGTRAHLNYGHTFAHALEVSSGFGGLRHGEAVALGMMAAAHLSHELGRLDPTAVDTHRRTLQAVGLPTTVALDLPTLERAWQHDKKYRDGVRFVILRDLGLPETGVEASSGILERVVERMKQ